ncbi:hypothetical protein BSKO_06642 [Bryopsis sp. KO-2023]|nr:hypothetical protein BSKO_06642 [Bryopsis sp. KO-2023]
MKKIGGRIGKLRRNGKSLPSDSTKLSTFPHFIAHSGIPEAADSLAYEPIQRLLAVGTSDGRIKVLGQHGVEKLLQSETPEGSRQILFLTNRGTVVRVENSGGLEVWSVTGGNLVCQVHVPSDAVYCVCSVPGEPYLMLGCRSGDLRVCCLVDSNGGPTTEGREVKGARLLNYRVPCGSLEADGELKSCSVCMSHAGPIALTLHSASGVALWNIRHQKLVLRISRDSHPELESCGGVSATCWAGHIYGPDYLATGHDSGDIFIWKLPGGLTGGVQAVPEMIHHCKVAPPGSQASKILGLSYVSGESDALLVMGGQCIEEPDTLTRLHIPYPGTDNEEVSTSYGGDSLPWFGTVYGYAMVPPNGSLEEYEDPVAALVLTEGGKLTLHDFDTQNPIPFSLPFQSSTSITASHILTVGNDGAGLAREIKQEGGELWKGSEEFGGMEDPLYKWVLSGGEAPNAEHSRGGRSLFYFSGHDDGAVRVWELMGETPRWIDTAPGMDVLAAMTGFKGVRVISVGGCGEILAVGYEKGDVRVFRYSSHPLAVETREITGVDRSPEIVHISQPEGYQLVLQVRVHGADIRSLAFDLQTSLLAVGDQSGSVSVIDLSSPSINFFESLSSNAIHGLMFSLLEGAKGETEKPGLYIVSEDSCITVVDGETGKHLGGNDGWLKPKRPSSTLGIALLDSLGHPVENGSTPAAEIPWLPETTWGRSPAPAGSDKSEEVAEKPEVVECGIPQPIGVQGDLTVDAPCSASDAAESGSPNALCLEPVESVLSDDFRAESPDMFEVREEDTDDTVKKGRMLGKIKVGKWTMGKKKCNKSVESLSSATSSPSKMEEAMVVDRMGSESGSLGLGEGSSQSDTFVLTMTDQFIRIYSPESVANGDRSVLHKVTLSSPAIFAAPFRHPTLPAAGVVVISENYRVHVFSLPSLDPVEDIPMEEIIGWSLNRNSDDSDMGGPRTVTAGWHGDVVICGELGEMMRFGLLEGCSNLKSPRGVYDWEVASAAYSARKAALQKTIAVPGAGGIGVGIKKGFGAFLDVARKARDEFDKTMKFHPSRAPPPAPDLHTLFHRGEVQIASTVGTSNPISPSARVDSSTEGADPRKSGGHVDESDKSKLSPKAAREQLLAGAKLQPNEDPKVRTADQIREAYGMKPRNANAKAERVGGIMAENLDKMKERGERLKGLDDKTAVMTNEAANFADLAKQLADQQKNRKWWQM